MPWQFLRFLRPRKDRSSRKTARTPHVYRPYIEGLEERCTPATLPTGFTEAAVASALSSGTAMELSPDGKLFVCEQGGTMEVWQSGSRLQANFFRDAPISVNSSGERGLLGVAFDPNYASNRFVYVYYTTAASPIHNRVSRFTANAAGDLALAGSETVLLDLDNLSSATNHNGGALHFGTDGKLYIAVGDNANSNNSQTLSNLLGKMLRINSDGSIPSDNPFFNTAAGKNRAIWALGLRNPFTFAVQPGTGRTFINDVGQSAWEEINDATAGDNFGWPTTEGPFDPAQFPNFTNPFFAYQNDSTTCAITGGTFYNPAVNQFPSDYAGDYFFADFCGDWIRRIDLITKSVTDFATGASAVVDLRTASDGSLFYLNRGTGQVFQVQFTAGQAPAITQHPANQSVSVGQNATFSVTATGAAPLSFQWQRDNGTGFSNISGATASSFTLNNAQLSDSGAKFRVMVSNTAGSATSNQATLTVTANQAPTGTITKPAAGTHYNAGQTIQYAGMATDPENGNLPASAFTWRVDFHHDTHVHPFIANTTNRKSGSFVIPRRGETEANVFYRIHLTVRDSGGLTHSSFRDVVPNTSVVTVTTMAVGLQVNIDGQPKPAPTSFTGVVGIFRRIEAPATQIVNGITYNFYRWSDSGARNHEISTPAVNRTYTALYSAAPPAWLYQINFQTDNAATPAGYLADYGLTFRTRPSGRSFGWNVDNRAAARDRNDSFSPNQRYDTLVLMQPAANPNAQWEIAVPNGTYRVHLVAGDPSAVTSVYKIDVEGTPAIDAVPAGPVRWFDNVVTVTVSDGRLTVSNAPGAVNNKICFIEIDPVTSGASLTVGNRTPGSQPPDGATLVSELTRKRFGRGGS